MKPYVGVMLVALVAFLVWLAMQMARTWRDDRFLIALAVAGLLGAAAMYVGLRRRSSS